MGQRQRWRRLAPETRREIIRMRAAGRTYRDILAELDVSMGTITTVMRPLGGVVRREGWNPTGVRLSLDERVEIKLGVERGLSLRAIAGGLGRDPATVCRELNRHGGRTRCGPRWSRDWNGCGPPARSPVVCGWTSATMPACGCRTRRSTRACMYKGAASCVGSWPPACAPGVLNAVLRDGSRT